jgi:hypothetical protein
MPMSSKAEVKACPSVRPERKSAGLGDSRMTTTNFFMGV